MSRRWRVAPDVAHVDDVHRVVALRLAPDGLPRVLEDTAAVVWRLLADRPDEEALLTAVADGFGTTPDAVRTDVLCFLESLGSEGLVVQDSLS